MKCHWAVDREGGLNCFIPGCYGGAADPSSCTCQIDGSRLDQAEAELALAQETITYLRACLTYDRKNSLSLRRNNDRLRDQIRELRGLPPRKVIKIGYP